MSRTKTKYNNYVTVDMLNLRKDFDTYCTKHGTTMTTLIEENDINSSFFKVSIMKYNRDREQPENETLGIVRESRFYKVCAMAKLKPEKYIVVEEPVEEVKEEPKQESSKEYKELTECMNILLSVMTQNLEEIKNLNKTMTAVKEELKRTNA